MKIVYIDDDKEFEPFIRLTCEMLGDLFHTPVEFETVIPAKPAHLAEGDLPVFFDDEGELIKDIRQIGDISANDLVWKSQLQQFLQRQDCIYLLDINFGRLLATYGLSIARYLKLLDVSVYRILLFSNYPSSAYKRRSKNADVPWRYVFDKEDFSFQNDEERWDSAVKLSNQINGLFADELIDNVPLLLEESNEIVGESEAWRAAINTANKIIDSSATVLILGETGTGKELIAKAIHNKGPRAKKPLVTINLANFPSELLESELFGHTRGAFTGAVAAKKGLFEVADGGSIFLDEIGDLQFEMQARLLRVIQERQFTPLGSISPRKVDVRIIAATNADLKEAVRQGRFRDDLYYRISVIPIELPPLRTRPDDIPKLVDHFLRKYARKHKRPIKRVSPEALRLLKKYDWPGNVRQLENVIERAVLLQEGDMITAEHLPQDVKVQKIQPKSGKGRLSGSTDLENWNYIEGVIKEKGKQISAAFKRWVWQIDLGDIHAEEVVWETITLAARMMCSSSKAPVRSEPNFHSVRIIIALLDRLVVSGDLVPDKLMALCATSNTETPLDALNFFKKSNNKIAGLGGSGLLRWSNDDMKLLSAFIKRKLAEDSAQGPSLSNEVDLPLAQNRK